MLFIEYSYAHQKIRSNRQYVFQERKVHPNLGNIGTPDIPGSSEICGNEEFQSFKTRIVQGPMPASVHQ